MGKNDAFSERVREFRGYISRKTKLASPREGRVSGSVPVAGALDTSLRPTITTHHHTIAFAALFATAVRPGAPQ